MNDSVGIPACFTLREQPKDDLALAPPASDPASAIRSGQRIFMSKYQTKIAGQSRLISITWCKNLLLHGLSVSVQGPNGNEHYQCKVKLKPWNFWKGKQGSKHFQVDGRPVGVVWDLKDAKFNGETEPQSNYYVAIVCEEETVLTIGDLKKEAFRRTGCRPALAQPVLVSKKEHVFGKKKFHTRIQFQEREKLHAISIHCVNRSTNTCADFSGVNFTPELEISIDGQAALRIEHLQWKFRGNDSVCVSENNRLEIFWDVHDWLFGAGPKQGLFIFRPIPGSPSTATSPSYPPSPSSKTSNQETINGTEDYIYHGAGGSPSFCLFLYAWRME